MESDKLAINVQVCGRNYRLNIERQQEELIRAAAKLVDDKVRSYKDMFKDKDDQDFLSMTAIAFTFEMLRTREAVTDTAVAESAQEAIDKIEKALSE